MPLANAGDPWRAQIGNSNATAVSNVVSLTVSILIFLFIFNKNSFMKPPIVKNFSLDEK